MNISRRKDLLFEINDILKKIDRYEKVFLILNNNNLYIIKNLIHYVDNHEAKIAKMLLNEEAATLVGDINQIDVYTTFDYDPDDYVLSKKPRSGKEAFAFGTYFPKCVNVNVN